MGLSTRDKYEHLDFRALSMTLPEYIKDRGAELRKNVSADLAQTKNVDSAVANGGIDLSTSNLDLQIKRDGAGVPLPVSAQDLDNIRIDGLVPVIVSIRPAAGLALFTQPPA